MKKATQLFVVIFTLLVSLNLKAGDDKEIKLPEFKGDVVVVKTYQMSGLFSDASLTIADGIDKPITLDFKGISIKNDAYNATVLSIVISQLKKQGYKLITSNAGGLATQSSIGYLSTYIFQKD